MGRTTTTDMTTPQLAIASLCLLVVGAAFAYAYDAYTTALWHTIPE